jgi:hypothetical protein
MGALEAVVDVCMPTRGANPFLREALDSIVAQSFADWRLTIAENGPGDPELAAIVEPYLADNRVTHLVRGEDIGFAPNHTELVRAASARYVAILHDDDVWEPEFLERRVRFLDDHPECGFVFGAFRTIDENGTVLARRRPPFAPGVVSSREFVRAMIHGNVIGMPTILVRKAAYEAVGSAFGDGFPMIDYEMWLRIGARQPIGFLDEEDAMWRFHSSQRSAGERRWGESWLAFYDAAEQALADTDTPFDPSVLRQRRTAAYVCAALDALESHEPAKAREYLRQATRLRRSSIVDPRVLAAATGLHFGRGGAQAVSALRRSVRMSRRRFGPVVAEARARVRPPTA